MEILKKAIVEKGNILSNNIVKVDSFLNHQIDVRLLNDIGKEFQKRFANEKITKILTIEASGIAVGMATALLIDVPLVFAKKHAALNLPKNVYKSKVFSFTKNVEYDVIVSKDFLNENDKVLIIDDFLATGNALLGLIDIVDQSRASIVGVGIVIEKSFQSGGKMIRNKVNRVESLAMIESIENNIIKFL